MRDVTKHYNASVMAISAITTNGGCWCLMRSGMLATMTMLMSFGHVLAMTRFSGLRPLHRLDRIATLPVSMSAQHMAQKSSEKLVTLGFALIVPGVPQIVC
jgi:hypothetical protein